MLEDAGYERSFVRIGGASAIVGAVLGMVGNLLHPVTPIDDPEGVRESIADSEIWVAIHLVIVFGITLMLGGLVAIYHSIRGGIAGALARFGLFAAVVGATVGLVLVIPSRLDSWPRSGQPHPLTKRPRHSASSTPTRPSTSRWPASSISSSPR